MIRAKTAPLIKVYTIGKDIEKEKKQPVSTQKNPLIIV